MDSREWYALQVYTGKERWVTAALKERGHDPLLLLYTVVSKWSDRRMQIDRAVFPGYVFCNLDFPRRDAILGIPGRAEITMRAAAGAGGIITCSGHACPQLSDAGNTPQQKNTSVRAVLVLLQFAQMGLGDVSSIRDSACVVSFIDLRRPPPQKTSESCRALHF